MPANIVKPGEEAAWTRAKNKVSEEYPDIPEDSDRYYKLVTTLFQNMKALDQNSDAMDLIDQDDDAELHKALHLVLRRIPSHSTRLVVRKAYTQGHARTLASGTTVSVPSYFTRRVPPPARCGGRPRAVVRRHGTSPSTTVAPEHLGERLLCQVRDGKMTVDEAQANLTYLEHCAYTGRTLSHGAGHPWTPAEIQACVEYARGQLAAMPARHDALDPVAYQPPAIKT